MSALPRLSDPATVEVAVTLTVPPVAVELPPAVRLPSETLPPDAVMFATSPTFKNTLLWLNWKGVFSAKAVGAKLKTNPDTKNRPINYLLTGNSGQYINTTVNATTSWQNFTYKYTATKSDITFFGIDVAQATGNVWIDKVSIQ